MGVTFDFLVGLIQGVRASGQQKHLYCVTGLVFSDLLFKRVHFLENRTHGVLILHSLPPSTDLFVQSQLALEESSRAEVVSVQGLQEVDVRTHVAHGVHDGAVVLLLQTVLHRGTIKSGLGSKRINHIAAFIWIKEERPDLAHLIHHVVKERLIGVSGRAKALRAFVQVSSGRSLQGSLNILSGFSRGSFQQRFQHRVHNLLERLSLFGFDTQHALHRFHKLLPQALLRAHRIQPSAERRRREPIRHKLIRIAQGFVTEERHRLRNFLLRTALAVAGVGRGFYLGHQTLELGQRAGILQAVERGSVHEFVQHSDFVLPIVADEDAFFATLELPVQTKRRFQTLPNRLGEIPVVRRS
ncbi:hypothetical protein D3C86_1024340 [compost metagenome]